MPTDSGQLTEKPYWDGYWEDTRLPAEIRRASGKPYLNLILDVLDRHLPAGKGLTALEVGGAPGQYLAYLHRRFGYEVHCVDYSDTGCAKTRANFALLGIPGTVHQADVLAGDVRLPLFDVVYSLGFMEHFVDLTAVVGCHLRLLKPAGVLMLGVPNLAGVNAFFLRRLAPQLLSRHNLAAMDTRTWRQFEERFTLSPVFRGYVGGFEPALFNRFERPSLRHSPAGVTARLLKHLFGRHFPGLRRFNSRHTSGYALGIYRSPGKE